MDLGTSSTQEHKTRSQDCPGSQGNSACWSWQSPLAPPDPGSRVRWGHVALGKAELHSHLYFERQCFIAV